MKAIFPWFEPAQKNLARALQSDRMAHAILITADFGCGKFEFASNLSQRLLCVNQNLLEPACGQCKSCLLFAAQTHPDFYLIQQLIDNKGKQKRSIGIEQIRLLTDKLADTAQLGGWRIALIASVSAMTTAAYNALLKTLEEPGRNTLLLLLADNAQRVPATIRSRCQVVQPDLNRNKLTDWLVTQSGHSAEAVEQSLNACFDAPLKARSYLETAAYEDEADFYQRCDQILLNDLTPQELLGQSTIEEKVLWQSLTGYFYQVEKARLENSGLSQYQKLPIQLPFELFEKLLEFNRAQLAGSNLQAPLQLQSILIQWYEAGRKIRYYSNK